MLYCLSLMSGPRPHDAELVEATGDDARERDVATHAVLGCFHVRSEFHDVAFLGQWVVIDFKPRRGWGLEVDPGLPGFHPSENVPSVLVVDRVKGPCFAFNLVNR